MTPEQRAARLRLVALDVDGVLTDGRLYYGPQGEALKVFDVRDGHGIKMLLNHGVEVAILSARSSDIVGARARELGIGRVLQGRGDKAVAWNELLRDTGVAAEQAGFIGDDLPGPAGARAGGVRGDGRRCARRSEGRRALDRRAGRRTRGGARVRRVHPPGEGRGLRRDDARMKASSHA